MDIGGPLCEMEALLVKQPVIRINFDYTTRGRLLKAFGCDAAVLSSLICL